jgi:hypothetical protein
VVVAETRLHSLKPTAWASFRRCTWPFATFDCAFAYACGLSFFAAAHAVAEHRGDPEDWWALAWLRGIEIATDVLWSRSPAFTRPGARAGLWFAGASNLAMALGFGWLARHEQRRGRFRLRRR